MMKRRVLAALLASLMMLSAGSCSFRDHSQPVFPEQPVKEDEADSSDYEKADIEEVNGQVEKLLVDLKVPDNEAAVREDMEALFHSVAVAYEADTLSHLGHCLDWYNEKAEQEYDDCSLTYSLVYEAASYAFHRGYESEEYSSLFTDYISEDYLDFYNAPSMSLKRLEGYTRVDYELADERSDEYYAIRDDEKLSDDEKNLKCAEIYLDILSEYDAETFYDEYYRDYTPEEIIEVGRSVRRNLLIISDDVTRKYLDNAADGLFLRADVKPDKLFSTIQKYSAQLSPEIAESAERIIETGHYHTAEGDDCYDGSYTAALPLSDDYLVYIYCDDNEDNLATAIHEFGHYHAGHFDKTPIYSVVANNDIAEIQSQGMELLFMQFYDEIYGKKADAMRLEHLSDLLFAIESGFLVGEFEYTVLKNRDTYTPEDVVRCYNEIMRDYAQGIPFYYIDHMFVYPGYYISYGVSALAALEIFDDVLNDPQSAVEKYSRMASIPSNDPNVRLREALTENGFPDIFSDEYINRLYDDIRRYLNSL